MGFQFLYLRIFEASVKSLHFYAFVLVHYVTKKLLSLMF